MPWEHETISQILKQLQTGAEAQSRPTLVVYPVPAGDPTAIVTVLKALVPKAQVVVDANTRSIAATALPADHELIRSAVEQLAKNEPPELARKMVIYPFKSINATAGYLHDHPACGRMFPDAAVLGRAPSRTSWSSWPGPRTTKRSRAPSSRCRSPTRPRQARRLNALHAGIVGRHEHQRRDRHADHDVPRRQVVGRGWSPARSSPGPGPAEHQQIAQGHPGSGGEGAAGEGRARSWCIR